MTLLYRLVIIGSVLIGLFSLVYLLDPVTRMDVHFATNSMALHNGFCSFTKLPPSATLHDILTFHGKTGHEPIPTIIEARPLIFNWGYAGALCDTKEGRQLFLIWYTPPPFGWSYRNYDVNQF